MMGITLARDDGDLSVGCRRVSGGVQPMLSDKHFSVFADGHTIYGGNGLHTDERFEFWIQDRSVDIESIRIGPVEDNKRAMVLDGGLDIFLQGGDIGIEADAYVLDIEEHDVHAFQIGGRGFAFAAIEGDNGYACFGIDGAVDMFAGIGVASEAMFGGKDLCNVYASLQEGVYEMAGADNGRLVSEDGDGSAFKEGQIPFHLVGAGEDAAGALFRGGAVGLNRRGVPCETCLAVAGKMEQQQAGKEQ